MFLSAQGSGLLGCAERPLAAVATSVVELQEAAPGQGNGGDWSGGGLFGNAAAIYATDPTSGLPLLHSLPGAHAAVFLDFDGWTGDGYGGYQSWTPYDTDGISATFNTSEQQAIAEGWRRIAEYMAPFNVDVTTEQPVNGDYSWEVISSSIDGGFSYGGWGSWAPSAFVNSSMLLDRTTAILHEMGHNFGMGHQSSYDDLGNKTAEYRGRMDSLHGVVMGMDYDELPGKWIAGHPGSTSTEVQDDVAAILAKTSANGGDGYRADDFGGTIVAATALTLGTDTYGVIERPDDTDCFSFVVTTAGPYELAVTPDSPSMLDAKLAVYDASNNLVAAVDNPSSISVSTALNLSAGTYYAIVESHGNYCDLGPYGICVSPIASVAGFNSVDIGGPSTPGASSYNSTSGEWTVTASGSDIWDTSDQFHYTYQTLTGNGTIVARVESVANAADSWAKAGIMIRNSTDAGSEEATMVITPGSSTTFQYRSTAGGSTSQVLGASVSAPRWLKLVRSGDTFTGYVSANGTSWGSAVGSVTIAMNSTTCVGLALTAHNDGSVATAHFSHVTITPSSGKPSAPTNLAAARGSASDVSLSWNAVLGATGYVVERSWDGSQFTRIGTTTASVRSYTDASPGGSQRWVYRVAAVNAFGAGTASNMVSIVNRPAAPADFRIATINSTTLVLDWRDTPTIGESGYRVERSTDSATWTTLTTLAANSVSYTDSTAISGTAYYYRVTPTSDLGDGPSVSGLSNIAPTVATAAAATPSPVNGTTTTLTVVGADDHGEANLTYTWTATTLPPGAAQPTYSDNGTNTAKTATATFSRAGDYVFQVTTTDAGGMSVTSSVSVTVNAVLTNVAVSPAAVMVVPSSVRQFTATALDQFGVALALQPNFTWIATAGTIAGGLFTAPSVAAAVTITASGGGKSGTSSITVADVPEIVSWASAEDYTNGYGELALTIPDDGTFSEPRSGGIRRLLVTFDRPPDAGLFTPSAVKLAGTRPDGTAVDVSGITISTSMRTSTLGVIEFGQSLPDVARYLVRLDTALLSLAEDVDRVLTAIAGDVSGDRRVDITDLLALKWQYTQRLNAASTAAVRADYSRNGVVDEHDLSVMWTQQGHDAEAISDPTITWSTAAAAPTAQSGTDLPTVSASIPTLASVLAARSVAKNMPIGPSQAPARVASGLPVVVPALVDCLASRWSVPKWCRTVQNDIMTFDRFPSPACG